MLQDGHSGEAGRLSGWRGLGAPAVEAEKVPSDQLGEDQALTTGEGLETAMSAQPGVGARRQQ